MKILSIDIGIKNFSFCLFETTSDKDNYTIIKWDNINLTEKTNNICFETDKDILCNKPAKFTKDGKCFCLKHSKKQPFLKPSAQLKQTYINKQKLASLIEIADKHNIKYDTPAKKSIIIQLLNEYITANCFISVENVNATKLDLVTIGRNIQIRFDDILCEHLTSIDKIIIENQIGPIANKMKTIQGMVSQYFIMRNNKIQIEFISASNKLKDFLSKDTDKINYKQRKQLGIKVCLDFVNNDSRYKEWGTFFNKHTKKDDLSDCFLQGMWYIKHKI